MEAKSQRVGRRIRGDLVAVVAVLLALVVGVGFYQEEVFTYFRLQGWNTGAVKETMERFVREAYNGQPSAGELLDTAWIQPVVEGGKLAGIRHSGARGPVVVRVKTMLPAGEMKDFHARIKNRSGVFQADVQFPNGQWGAFDVGRVRGAYRIRSVPDVLGSTQQKPNASD